MSESLRNMTRAMFQSLFFWMRNHDFTELVNKTHLIKVSILVLLDEKSRPFIFTLSVLVSTSFNPCSSGWEITTISLIRKIRTTSSFNPCSSGWEITTLNELEKGRSYRSFNPCSSGWEITTVMTGCEKTERNQFQSLFFWMRNHDQERENPMQCLIWFQSLFFWMRNHDVITGRQKKIAKTVSILVLLDEKSRPQ